MRFLAVFLACFTLATHAQTCPLTPVGDKDGVDVSPAAHHLLYEDADVRVIEVIVPPHSMEEAFHTHLRDSVFLMLEDGPYQIHLPDGHVKTPPVSTKPTAYNFARPEQLHRVENLSDHRQHALRIELKHQGCGPTRPLEDLVGMAPGVYKLDFETNDVRVLEVTLAPHTAEPKHRADVPFLLYVEAPAPLKTTGAKLDRKKITDSLSRVEIGGTHAARNDSDSTFHAFRIELKRAEANAR